MQKHENQPTAYLIHGFIGAGKTTFSKKLSKQTGAIRFTTDEWMIDLFGTNPPKSKFNTYYKNVDKLINKIAFKCLKSGVSVIFDSGFWSFKQREQMRKKLSKAGVNYVLYFVKTDENIMKKRTLQRTNKAPKDAFYINEEAIIELKKQFEPLKKHEKHVVVKG